VRIHTDKIETLDIVQAKNTATLQSGGTVHLEELARRGSRRRARAFEVRLTGDGTLTRRRINAGTSRDVDRFSLPYAATWEQWGWFLVHLFTVDPDMVAGPYDGAEDFHRQTRHAFDLPIHVVPV
jgi:hypothetical protein